MKVLNLRCAHEHRFEGWFGSDDDFARQGEQGLIACPLCDDKAISRLPSAPRLNVFTPRGEGQALQPVALDLARVHGEALRVARELLQRTEDVGDRFAEEARRIHYGEAAWRGIRGRASANDASALRDEGIEIVSMLLPEALKNTMQ